MSVETREGRGSHGVSLPVRGRQDFQHRHSNLGRRLCSWCGCADIPPGGADPSPHLPRTGAGHVLWSWCAPLTRVRVLGGLRIGRQSGLRRPRRLWQGTPPVATPLVFSAATRHRRPRQGWPCWGGRSSSPATATPCRRSSRNLVATSRPSPSARRSSILGSFVLCIHGTLETRHAGRVGIAVRIPSAADRNIAPASIRSRPDGRERGRASGARRVGERCGSSPARQCAEDAAHHDLVSPGLPTRATPLPARRRDDVAPDFAARLPDRFATRFLTEGGRPGRLYVRSTR